MVDNKDTCCICLEKNLFVQSISSFGLFRTIKTLQKLETCVPGKVWQDWFNLCNDCEEKLETLYSFVQICLKSEEHRRELLKSYEEKEPSSFTCFLCEKTFSLKRALGLHITRIHTNRRKNKSTEPVTKPVTNPEPKSKQYNSVNNKEIKNLKTELKEANHKEKIKKEESNDDVPHDVPQLHEELIKTDIEEDGPDCDNGQSEYEEDIHLVVDDRNGSSSEDDLPLKNIKTKKRGRKLKGSLRCEFCELKFRRSDRLDYHIRTKHTFEKPFECSYCDSKYYTQSMLNVHTRKHTKEKPYICSKCGKCFSSSNEIWQHNKIHNDVRSYGCDECEKCFKTHSNLRTHKLQMHQDPSMWKHICTICGKRFPLNTNLVKHIRRHEGIKPFGCQLCSKRFVEKIDLISHMTSHSNERQFKCDLCMKEYKKAESLRRHMKLEHDIGTMVIKKPVKKLSCPLCPKLFAFNNKLQRHLFTHTGEKPIKCEHCDKRFRDNSDRNRHFRDVHNLDDMAVPDDVTL